MNVKHYNLSVKAVVFNASGHCLLLRRSQACRNNAGCWEFPGGKLDPGEKPDEALVREMREETGLSIQVCRVAGAGESELPEYKVAYLFFEATAPSSEVRLSDEHDAHQWIEPGQLATPQLCPQFRAFASDYARRHSESAPTVLMD